MTVFAEVLQQSYLDRPDQIAIYLQHAGRPDLPISYRRLLEGANGYAQSYQARGILPGDVVVLILQHGEDLIYSYFGAVLHGAIPSIMPFLTEKLSAERYRADLTSLVEITRPAAIVTYPEFEAEVQSALKSEDSVRAVILTSDRLPDAAPDFATLPGLLRQPEDIVLLQHSSGTTGLQKGIALSHRAVFNQLETYNREIRLAGDDVIVSWLPLYHDMGLIAGFLMPILLGIPLVLMSPFDWVRAPYRLLQAVGKYRGTISWLPNFAYNFCAQKIRDRDLEGIDLSSWRAVINCSEPVRYDSHQAMAERFAAHGLRPAALMTCYAMAENVFAVTQGGMDGPLASKFVDRETLQIELKAVPPVEGKPSLHMLSTGRAIANTRIRILTPEGRELPDNRVGEVAIQSDCMLTGFFHREDLTKQAFVDGWYLTGDFGYLDAGELYITGRKKDLIIVGGKNIYPQDLERLAMEVNGVHPGRVVTFGVYNEDQGTEEVFMVIESDLATLADTAEHQRLIDEVRQVVTRGSAVALRQVAVVPPMWIIKTSSGKTARGANRDKFLREQNLA
ncbi:MAG: AMP-binding protein [Anaerolineaceae bacterium]